MGERPEASSEKHMVKKIPDGPPAQHSAVDVHQGNRTTEQQAPQQFVRLKQFIALMGWSRSTYYNRVAGGVVPAARTNGPRTRGYFASEVVAIQQALMTDPPRSEACPK